MRKAHSSPSESFVLHDACNAQSHYHYYVIRHHCSSGSSVITSKKDCTNFAIYECTEHNRCSAGPCVHLIMSSGQDGI